MIDKDFELKKIALKRKNSIYIGYENIPEIYDKEDYVTPYTKSAHNINTEIIIILQDWSSDSIKRRIDYDAIDFGYTRKLQTNVNLKQFLKSIFNKDFEDIYITNLFPYLKKGSMSSRIPFNDLVRAAIDFCIPQIEIIKPKLVICLGLNTYNAINYALNRKKVNNLSKGIDRPFQYMNSQIWLQAHTGFWGQLVRNKYDKNQTEKDWIRMKSLL